MNISITSAKGVTLFELMITVAVIAVLASIAIPMYSGYIQSSYRAECQNEISAIRLAQEEFFLENNEYFPTGGGSTTGATNIKSASGDLYEPSVNATLSSAYCDYNVNAVAAGGGTPASYTITAIGQNELSGKTITYP